MRALWSERRNCSHNVSQKVKRIRRFSEKRGSVREPSSDSFESGHSRESANRFGRIRPSKYRTNLFSISGM